VTSGSCSQRALNCIRLGDIVRSATLVAAVSILVVACGGDAEGVADPRDGGDVGGSSGSGGGAGATGGSAGSGGTAGESGTAGSGTGGSPCTPSKPYEGSGVTAAYEGPSGTALTLISVDKYWLFDWTSGWSGSGLLASVPAWSAAPAVGGLKPYEGEGVTAAYNDPSFGQFAIISKDKYWIFDRTSNSWTSSGLLQDAWAAAPEVNGLKPFQGDGVTAAYNNPGGSTLTIISRDKYWLYTWGTSTWSAGGLLSNAWSAAPSVAGVKPFEGDGVTAAYNDPSVSTLSIISRDKYWQYTWATSSWTGSGSLADAWATAPTVGCP
jgi:hypothetical protein